MNRTTKILFALLIFSACSSNAWAWNSQGHMLVADLAWAQLAALPLVRAAITGVLKKAKNKFHPEGTSASAVRDAFDYAATFPDVIKRDLSTAYEPLVSPMNLSLWPNQKPDQKAGNERYRCKSWHYYDTPIRFTGPKPSPWPSNLLVAYPKAVQHLHALHHNKPYTGPTAPNISKDDLKFWWLGWLLHLSGDAHQPLHCMSDYKYVTKDGDDGGNKFPVAGGELHAVWDNMLVKAATRDDFHISDVERSTTPSTKLAPLSKSWLGNVAVPVADASDLDPAHWVAVGADAAENIAYKGIVPNQTLTPAYYTKAENYARKAAVLGGRRLANALAGIFQ